MTRRVLLTAIPLVVIVFWTGLFAVLPWYYPAGIALCLGTLLGVLIYAELHFEVPQPTPEDMANQPDLWSFPTRCHESFDQAKRAA